MEKYMDAIVKAEAGPGLELRRVPVPVPGPGEVLIKVRKTAICGTDVHIYNWDPWATEHIKPPMTIGHEYVGEIAQLGDGVTGLYVGQRVSGEGHITCHHCRNCHNGNIQWCKDTKSVGVDRDGAFAEYVCIPQENVIIIDENLPEDVVAFFDAFGNATHTALMFPLIGEDVLITGAGPIGIIAAAVCKHAGARRVVITDINDYRLELAHKCGADVVVNTRNNDFGKALVDCFGPDKADVIYDCAGNNITMDQAIQNARKGSTIILVAVFADLARCDLAKLNDSELDLNTTMMYRHEDYVDAIRLVGEGKIQLKPLMSKHFAFQDYIKSYEYIDANQETTMKVLIDVDPNND